MCENPDFSFLDRPMSQVPPRPGKPRVIHRPPPRTDAPPAMTPNPEVQIHHHHYIDSPPTGSNNAGPTIACVLIPGLGQLIQGRILPAVLFFLGAVLGAFLIVPGLVCWIWSIIDAALYRPRRK